jgi:predicted nucleic acid-binding protein
MVKPKLYLETTVFNYCFDKDRDDHPAAVALIEAIGRGEFIAFTSDYTITELKEAPEPKRTEMLLLIEKYRISIIEENEEVLRMADVYIQNKIIPEKKQLDARHIAIASVHHLDYIISLNFKHINKLKTKRLVDAVNVLQGYDTIAIYSPMEVIDDEV